MPPFHKQILDVLICINSINSSIFDKAVVLSNIKKCNVIYLSVDKQNIKESNILIRFPQGKVHTLPIKPEINWLLPLEENNCKAFEDECKNIKIEILNDSHSEAINGEDLFKLIEKEIKNNDKVEFGYSHSSGNSYPYTSDTRPTTRSINEEKNTDWPVSNIKSKYENNPQYIEKQWTDIDYAIEDDELSNYVICEHTGRIFKKIELTPTIIQNPEVKQDIREPYTEY